MRPLSHCKSAATSASRRGDAAKVIIITVCAFGMIMLLLCAGAGIYGYVVIQRNLARMVVQTPAELRTLSAEITDIEIPPQFTPVVGSAMFGMKSVNYAWNPAGKPLTAENWHESQDELLSMLSLMEMMDDSNVGNDDFTIPSYQKKVVKKQYAESEVSLKEFQIRGRKCEFLFVTGRAREGAFEDEMLFDEVDEEEMAAEEQAVVQPDKPAADPAAVDAAKPDDAAPASSETGATTPAATEPVPATVVTAEKLLPAVRSVTGSFPGKSGPTTISIRVPADTTDEDFLLKIIQSIR